MAMQSYVGTLQGWQVASLCALVLQLLLAIQAAGQGFQAPDHPSAGSSNSQATLQRQYSSSRSWQRSYKLNPAAAFSSATPARQLAESVGGQGPDYAVTLRQTVKSQELGCNYVDEFGQHVDYCRVCGGVEQVAARCDANPECESFDMENPKTNADGSVKWCGYLKKATRPFVYMENFANYCKLGKNNNCQVQGTYRYKRGVSLRAADINCNYKNKAGITQPKCFVSGFTSDVMEACDANPKCKAFDYATGRDLSSYGGWLKSSGGSFESRPGAAVYVRQSSG